ncbi:prolyl 4-hydroxylase [Fistulifera solaris]|uniref:Prolyl 4-hydroxylase n=1 Tax=Fistulifera solaris TaxID=1519565 RepID=A0A1Z5JS14_FISSO|nr:prolyl 4-hydroxylase [Fistulifera solaris]|eukprot:GAX16815.1 prolyl 4-hydroxylase [Fistulifera solaris]
MKLIILALLSLWVSANVVSDAGGACLNRNLGTFEGLAIFDEALESGRGCEYDVEETAAISESSYERESPAVLEKDKRIGADMGEPQVIDGDRTEEILKHIADTRVYLKEKVMVEPQYEKVRDICMNKHTSCTFWAVIGECDKNPAYMELQCAPACRTCEQLHVETRCPLDENAIDALYPGDLDRMFERIITEPELQQYGPVVLSRPSYAPGDGPNNATYNIGIWMIQFENALSEEEADRMIELGGIKGYERSKDVGEKQPDGTYQAHVNTGRTSTNAWCVDSCYTDPVAQTLMARIETITGIPETNSENLQLLRYEESQFYQTHNDYINYQIERPCGVRVLTFYMYLNDVEEGGGTDFPRLNMTVMPKKGRAVMWPSVLNMNPNKKDPRSDHQALPVIKGVKYGANAWIHMRDFKTPNKKGC